MWNTITIQYNPLIEEEWDEHFKVTARNNRATETRRLTRGDSGNVSHFPGFAAVHCTLCAGHLRVRLRLLEDGHLSLPGSGVSSLPTRSRLLSLSTSNFQNFQRIYIKEL